MRRHIVKGLWAVLAIVASASCGALDVSDPTAIEEKDVDNAIGAELLRRDALSQFYLALPDHINWTGMLSDELTVYAHPNSFDRRDVVMEYRLATMSSAFFPQTGIVDGGPYVRWHNVRTAATLALDADAGNKLTAESRSQLYALRGYATLSLAESFCPGFPLRDIVNKVAVTSGPLTTGQVFERALADLDSALLHGAGNAAATSIAQVGRGRVLLGLGRFNDAAAAVASVPTSFKWEAEFSSSNFALSNDLQFWSFSRRRSVADQEGSNGVDYLSAQDPRAVTQLMWTNSVTGQRVLAPVKYLDLPGQPIVVASGVEARLIETEAETKTGNGNWLSLLNTLRATQISPALEPLTDPGNDSARLDLVFRERAFWMFLTGHRLADMRRLITLYGRSAESVFPVGPYPVGGGSYGSATSLAFPVELEAPHNPEVTGCTDS